jgi:hypothetical protein
MNRTLAEEVYLAIWQSEATAVAVVAVVVVLALVLLIIGSIARFLLAVVSPLTTDLGAQEQQQQQPYDNANVVEMQETNKLKDMALVVVVVVTPSAKEKVVGKRKQQRPRATKDMGLPKKV